MTGDDPDDIRADIAEHIRLHPDDGVTEVLGALGLSPAWRDAVMQALDAEDPAAALSDTTEPGNTETSHGEDEVSDSRETHPPEGDSPDETPTPDVRKTASDVSDTAESPRSGQGSADYIDDTGFAADDDAVREYYSQVAPVYDALASIDGTYPTLAFAGNAGWYDHRHVTRVEPLEAGWDARSRALTLARDWDRILEDVGADGKARTLYNIASWKTQDSVFQRRLHRYDSDAGEQQWQDGEKPLPDYRDLRGFGFWVDLDLADELKPRRGDLDHETVATVEAAQAALIDEVADLYGVDTDAIYGLDSGGGSYVYGPPEATIPIAEYYGEDGDARELVLDEVRNRLTSWAKGDGQFEGMWPRVVERVDDAGEVLDPDFMQNKNRQSKAPLAIHQDHDVVVTPLRSRDPETGAVDSEIDYSPTLVSDVDEDLIAETASWARGLTDTTHTDAVDSFVTTLWPEYADEHEEWTAILDAWLADERADEDPATGGERDASRDEDVDLSGLSITTNIDDVYADIDSLDSERVAEKTIVHKWTDEATGLTDRSGDGKRAFVPQWGTNANSGNANYIDTDRGTWVDTANGDHGTAVEMALIAEENWTRGEIADGEAWARGVECLRRMGFDIQVHIPDARDADDGQMPYWAVRRAALAFGILEEDEFVERESEDGDSYLGFPDADTYQETLDELAERGVEHGRDPETDERTPRALPTEDLLEKDTTLSRREAWRAAGAVIPEDLDPSLGLETDGNGWVCPTCEERTDDVVRAVGVATDTLDCCGDPFDEPDVYDRLYTTAREEHGAPLPEYIPPTQVVGDIDRAYGATSALRGWHIVDALESETTNDNPSGEDAVAEIDPTWEESDSGKRIVLFASGLFYCREHERVLWPLQVVALEQGLVDSEDDRLAGDAFLQAYALARIHYDAPLPEILWNDVDEAPEPLHLPVLPDPDDLLGDGVTTDADELQDARDDVESLYSRLADRRGSPNYLLTALPALGKTYSMVTHADEYPTLYTAKRKELRQEAAEDAAEHGISAMHCPTLGETRPPSRVLSAAVSHVQEHGRRALRDRDALLEAVEDTYYAIPEEWPAYEREYGDDETQTDDRETDMGSLRYHAGDDCPGCGRSFETTTATRRHIDQCDVDGSADVDSEDVHLDRAACESGNGEHGPEWQLAIWTARQLGDKPRALHEKGETIFGEDPPCACDGKCPYTLAWERATDPDAPIDLLIGHPVHAYVGGARVQPQRGEEDSVYAEDRVVGLDEFPADVYTTEFGDEFIHHARWLAECLSSDVEDTTDLLERRRDLWNDQFVVDYLNGEASPPILDALEAKRNQAEDDDAPDPDYTPLLDADLGVDGDLAALVERAVEAAADPDRDGEELLESAMTALRGGRDGVEVLASGAEDGYAHPDAYWLLLGLLPPEEFSVDDVDDPEDDWRASVRADVKEAEHFGFHSQGGRIKTVTAGERVRILIDRDFEGATLLTPPDLRSNTVIGLDATGRTDLWELAVGDDFQQRDIHETAAERQAFLRDVMNLRVVQSSPHVHSYSGNPTGKNFGDDIALTDHVADLYGERQLAQDRLTSTSSPAVVTTKKVEDHIGGDLLEAGAGTVEHFGDLIGSNRLAEYNVGVILGAEHYGHDAAEKWALLAGEEFEATGKGVDLDYNSPTANAMLKRMRDDKVMQSIMRFGRDEEGALVFAHTAALRDDVPVVDHADVAKAFTQNQRQIARAAADLSGGTFTTSDVLEDDRVDCHRRTVRRNLNEFADLGYLERDTGHTNGYDVVEDPGTGQVEMPESIEPPGGGGISTSQPTPNSGQTANENITTRFVWSCDADESSTPRVGVAEPVLGPPTGEIAARPSG